MDNEKALAVLVLLETLLGGCNDFDGTLNPP